MSNTKVKFTPEQEASVLYRGGSLLVSAAAGSGKTKVLVERLLGFVDEGINIDEFLVITYTRAAAFELRERIHEELLSKLHALPGNKRLRRQALLCRGASIDTIHTICGEIIRENAHLARLPADFKIVDGSESLMLQSRVIDDLLTEIYENIDENPGFKQLIDTVAGVRDDSALAELIIDIYNKLRSLPYPRQWLQNQIEKLKDINIKDIAETECGAYILRKLKTSALYIKKELLRLYDEMEVHPDFKEKYKDSVDEIAYLIDGFLNALESGWDAARENSNFIFSRPKNISGYEELKEIRKNCIAELRKCATELKISSDDHIKEAVTLSPAITTLMELLLQFDDSYSEEKRKRAAVDFSDLEHLMLSLLIDEVTGEKTELAKNLSHRYKEIMIDEYQDINAVQEMIFNAISKNNENIFMVGDVKQAIYKFRQSDPTIFLSKYSSFKEYSSLDTPEQKTGTKIHLSQNFRSKRGVLDTVNLIFESIMSIEVGELDYGEKEKLIAGREDEVVVTEDEDITDRVDTIASDKRKQGKQGKPYIENDKEPDVCIDLIDLSTFEGDSDEENPVAIKMEAQYVASKIEELTDGTHYIRDEKGIIRPAVLSDVTILLRSMKGRAWIFAAALAERGILSEYPGGEGYFETLEVSAILSLLCVVDNPLQDIPLISVLTGPIYRFSSDELTEIRSVEKNTNNYYDALKKSAEHESCSHETRLKCKKILDDIENMRTLSKDMTADRFIWYIYNSTGLLALVGAMRNGEKRKRNLIMLAEFAQNLGRSEYKGLFGFLTYIEALKDRGESLPLWKEETASSDSINAVKIMSIHKSKGLEFPIVFLSNTAKRFNFMDMIKSTVFHSQLGIGTMMVNKKQRTRHSTLYRNAIKTKQQEEMYSEELRVLYVAMTRAREKLIITAALKDAGKTLTKINDIPPGKVDPVLLSSMRCLSDWILTGVRNSGVDFVKARVIPMTDSKSFEVKKEIVDSSYELINELQSQKSSGKIVQNEFIPYIYPYQQVINLPSKLTVTGMLNIIDSESEKAGWLKGDEIREIKLQNPQNPSFLSENRQMTGSERGTMMHLIMQHVDHTKCSNDNEVAIELQRLKKQGVLRDEHLSDLDAKLVANFFSSDLGVRMINAKNVQKEFKFSLLTPAKLLFPDSGDDTILTQGVIDCYFEEDGEYVIIDFKSDKVTDDTVTEKCRQYTPQLKAYADALERITSKKVKEAIIYFFAIDASYIT